jgi:uncharacterized protein
MPSSLCDKCAALCCRYFALPIDNPKTARQYDDIRWYLIHENVVVYIEKKQWYLGIMTRCKHLQPDNRCGIYETRPRICRDYSTDSCDYHGGEYDFEVLFTSGEQLAEYAREKLRHKREKARLKKCAEPAATAGRARPRVMGHPSLGRRRQGSGNGRARSVPVNRHGQNGNGQNGHGRLSLPVLPR